MWEFSQLGWFKDNSIDSLFSSDLILNHIKVVSMWPSWYNQLKDNSTDLYKKIQGKN
jgi:hypothetical protein